MGGGRGVEENMINKMGGRKIRWRETVGSDGGDGDERR